MANRKTSKKRQSILDALMATTEHPNAEQLYQKLKPEYPDLSLGTVYRNLSMLAATGEIQRLGSFGGQERFDGRTDPHAHLFCTACGRVMDIDMPGLEAKLCALAQSASEAEVQSCTLTFAGVCPDCRKKADQTSAFE